MGVSMNRDRGLRTSNALSGNTQNLLNCKIARYHCVFDLYSPGHVVYGMYVRR